MNFWDSSAIAPLILEEKDTKKRESSLRQDSLVVVWYGTPAEIESAICRRVREGTLSPTQAGVARERASEFLASCAEVEPGPAVRERAMRLLRLHPLRAADAFQLAAALIVCADRPSGVGFLTSDHRLGLAAELEGFQVQ